MCSSDLDFAAVCKAADELRAAVNGDVATYAVVRNINYTNICYFRCGFCAFSKGKLAENLRGPAYLVPEEEIVRRVQEAWERGGTEVVQVYVGFPPAAGEPPRQLKGMAKVALGAGASREVVIPLGPRAFQVWDPAAGRWVTPAGTFQIVVGRSSREFAATLDLLPRPGAR